MAVPVGLQKFLNILVPVILCLNTLQVWARSDRSFTVDFTNHTFVKDGQPFQYVSGSIHYSRVPFYYWHDRLAKMRAAGLDAIQVYVAWNVHEPQPGVYDFEGQQDIVKFIETAQNSDLLVILRAGPYICGEWEFGGFPWWLLQKNSSVVLRTMDPGYITPVDRWLSVFLPKIKPLLYSNGGPVVMVQVENEYGSYFACDHDYMEHLKQNFRKYLGDDIVLFTTDGNGDNFLKCGAHEGLFTTVDFGPGNATKAFEALVKWQPGGPLVNSEFYTGWLDYWGGNHAHGDTNSIVDTMKQMLDMGASVNMYMFEGGTNFGFTNGADPPFNVCPTSYDYDAPLSEAGDITPKYTAIRNLLAQYKRVPPGPVPPSTPKYNYGSVSLLPLGSFLDLKELAHSDIPITNSMYPLTMEQLGQASGFIIYHTKIPSTHSGAVLNVSGIRDMGYVLVNGLPVGMIDRSSFSSLPLVASAGDELDIVVENRGRINFGKDILYNTKGIISNVTLTERDETILTNWTMIPLNFSRLSDEIQKLGLGYKNVMKSVFPEASLNPSVYIGHFYLPSNMTQPQDTYLNMTGWFKGQAYINGFNLGRYWPVKGPQVTLFLPAPLLMAYPALNVLMMVELQKSPCPVQCSVSLSDTPFINGSTGGFETSAKPADRRIHLKMNAL